MCYVALIEEAGLSSKEKLIKHSRGRNIHSIITKLGKFVGLIKSQISYLILIGEAAGRKTTDKPINGLYTFRLCDINDIFHNINL